MGCIYSNFSGLCTISSKNHPTQGCDEEFNENEEMYGCVVEDDPVPADNCEQYESDSACSDCGADYNAGEECEC